MSSNFYHFSSEKVLKSKFTEIKPKNMAGILYSMNCASNFYMHRKIHYSDDLNVFGFLLLQFYKVQIKMFGK
jgi:hypothetical protein